MKSITESQLKDESDTCYVKASKITELSRRQK